MIKKTTAKKPKKRIRYNEEIHVPIIKKAKEEGKTDAEISEMIGINERTLYKWRDKHEKLRQIFLELPTCASGRKEKYIANQHPHQVRYLKSMGMTNKEIAKELDIAEATIYDWDKKYPEFSEALAEGRLNLTQKLFQTAITKAVGGYEKVEKRTTYTYMLKPGGSRLNPKDYVKVPERCDETTHITEPDIPSLFKFLSRLAPEHFGKIEEGEVKDKQTEEAESEFKEIAEKMDRSEMQTVSELLKNKTDLIQKYIMFGPKAVPELIEAYKKLQKEKENA